MTIAKQILENLSEGGISTGQTLKDSKRVHRSALYVRQGDILVPEAEIPQPVTEDALPAGIYELGRMMSGAVYLKPHEVQTDDLIRFEDARHALVLSEIKKFWEAKPKFKEAGFTHKRGMLLAGAPGCGKTCLLKQVMEDVIEDGDVILYANSANMVKEMLRHIKDIESDRNILVVFEDIDEVIRYDEHSILQLMDGDNQQEHVLILATTNYPERLPPRVMRPGRFDRKLEIGPIPETGRHKYFSMKLEKMGKMSEDDINEYVDATEGFSFAQMREFLVSVYCLGYPASDAATRIAKGTIEESYTEAQLDEKLLSLKKG